MKERQELLRIVGIVVMIALTVTVLAVWRVATGVPD